jgi:hypothetical protein
MAFGTRLGPILVLLAAACGSDDGKSGDCPDGQVKRSVCIACGPAGGCGESAEQCVMPCTTNTDCNGTPLLICFDGVCQVGGCD